MLIHDEKPWLNPYDDGRPSENGPGVHGSSAGPRGASAQPQAGSSPQSSPPAPRIVTHLGNVPEDRPVRRRT